MSANVKEFLLPSSQFIPTSHGNGVFIWRGRIITALQPSNHRAPFEPWTDAGAAEVMNSLRKMPDPILLRTVLGFMLRRSASSRMVRYSSANMMTFIRWRSLAMMGLALLLLSHGGTHANYRRKLCSAAIP